MTSAERRTRRKKSVVRIRYFSFLSPLSHLQLVLQSRKCLFCSCILFVLLAGLFLPTGTCFGAKRSPHVVFLNPADENDSFWKMTTDFLLAAADDLNIQVEVLYSRRNHIMVVNQAREILTRSSKPDYILTGNEKGSAGPIVRLAQEHGVKVFLFNNGFVNPDDLKEFPEPRATYPLWIGQYIPDNFDAGYQIGDILVSTAIDLGLKKPEKKLNIISLAGAYNTHASLERVNGLKSLISMRSDEVALRQVVPGDWTEKTAQKRSHLVLQRYSDIDIIWAANDVTAFGAMTSALSFGLEPGGDILFGSCGWYPPAIERVREGTLVTTVGGHFMDGAWSLVMLHDYHLGKDFINEKQTSQMHAIHAGNVEEYLDIFSQEDWGQIDFTRFSKVLNPALQNYDFSLDRVLEQFE